MPVKNISKITIGFLLSLILSNNIIAAPKIPDLLKTQFSKLNQPKEIEKLRNTSTPLDIKKQKELIEYYKKLDNQKDSELRLMVKLAPYMASKLAFGEYCKLVNFYIIKDFETPAAVKLSLLQEIGYMGMREESINGKAYKFLTALTNNADPENLLPGDEYMLEANEDIFSRIFQFQRIYKNLYKEINKNTKNREMLYACLENQLANPKAPKRLIISVLERSCLFKTPRFPF